MTSQLQKAQTFQKLHESGFFILPNPWDVGSARVLQGMGFSALATTSAGFAASVGRPDYAITRDEKLAHVKAITSATDLPVTADLENGFGHSPDACADTICLGAEAGLVGGSIEDFSSELGEQYAIEHATERVQASVEAARSLDFPFMLTARAENFFTGEPDLGDTITRLQAYQEAGADVLYAPSLRTLEDMASVLASIDRPLNVLIGPFNGFVPMKQLADMGVRRVSLGSSLANLAYGALVEAAGELQSNGTTGFTGRAISGDRLAELMK